jgi:hypothetical protein
VCVFFFFSNMERLSYIDIYRKHVLNTVIKQIKTNGCLNIISDENMYLILILILILNIHSFIHECMCVCVSMCVCMCVCMCVYACLCVSVAVLNRFNVAFA